MDKIPFTRTYGKHHRAAFVACRDSLSQLQARARHAGIDTSGMLLLSRADDPLLRTIDDIMAAVPDSVEVVALDDAEHLLPAGERTWANVRNLLESAHIRYFHRRLTVFATTGIPEPDGLG